jgi:uncharacterized Zn-binding protein involved in type VI secretion
MPASAVTGATMLCTFGTAPSTLSALPQVTVTIEGRPAAVITNIIPGMNIPPFAMCTSLSNPTVAAATAAALGTLTPMPCVPVPVRPWAPGSPTTTIAGQPALSAGSTCQCMWGGVISMTTTGAARTSSG